MEPVVYVIGAAAVALAVLIVAALWMMSSKRRAKRTNSLREGFGPEYTRAVGEQGRASGEAELLKRQERADQFEVRPLSAIEVEHFTQRWTETQAQFIQDPSAALSAADHLVAEVIGARGYPADFARGADALSVDHPRSVQEYRVAHEAVVRNEHNALPADDLFATMAKYQAVFTSLMAGSARQQAASG